MYYKKVTANADNVLGGVKRIVGARLVAGSDAATAILFNGTQTTANDFCKLTALTALDTDSEVLDITVGVAGLGVTLSGTSPILYVYYV